MSDLSWLNPTPHAIAVYASRPLSPVATQHSLPSGRYPLLGPDLHRLDRTSLRLAHSLRSTLLRSLRACSTHVTVPEQLVAVQILLTPFQDPDRCDTMCCLVLTRAMRRREFIALMGGSGGRSRCAQQSPQEYALM